MRGIFVGLTEHELLTIRDTAKAAVGSGTVQTSFSAPGLSGSQEVVLRPAEALQEATYALQKLYPDLYGRHLITTRTTARFR